MLGLPIPPDGRRYYMATLSGLPTKGVEIYQADDKYVLVVRDRLSYHKLRMALLSLRHHIENEDRQCKLMNISVDELHVRLNKAARELGREPYMGNWYQDVTGEWHWQETELEEEREGEEYVT